jgi:hypothetical protein
MNVEESILLSIVSNTDLDENSKRLMKPTKMVLDRLQNNVNITMFKMYKIRLLC